MQRKDAGAWPQPEALCSIVTNSGGTLLDHVSLSETAMYIEFPAYFTIKSSLTVNILGLGSLLGNGVACFTFLP